MKPIQLIDAVLNGESVVRPPFCLYPSYSNTLLDGATLALTVEAFVEKFEPDVVVVPACFGYTLPTNLSLDRPADLTSLEAIHGRHGVWSEQQEAIRRVCQRYHGKRYVLAVVPSAFRQLQLLAGTRLIQEALHEAPGFLFQALEALNQSLVAFIKVAREAGIQGVLIEESGASHEYMTPATYREKVQPLLEAQFQAAAGLRLNVAQFLGRRIFWDEFQVSCTALGWPIEAGPGFRRGAQRFHGRPVWGGLDPNSWSEASSAWLRGSLRQQLNDLPETPFVLAPPQGLSDLRLDQIEALAHGLRRLPSPERLRETPADLEARRAATPPKPRRNKEVREPFVREPLEPPKPAKGAKIRLHGKSSPAEPWSPTD